MQLEFRRIQQELGVTTINVTHDQREALVMSDHIVVMNEGVVQQSDTPLAIYRKPSNRFVANFIGVTSIFKATVQNHDVGKLVVSAGKVELIARCDQVLPAQAESVECALRAEQIRIVSTSDAYYDNIVLGTVVQRIFEGDRLVYDVQVKEMDNVILSAFDHDPLTHTEYALGDRVSLGWNADDLLAFPVSNQVSLQ